jgi:hypothetical protein
MLVGVLQNRNGYFVVFVVAFIQNLFREKERKRQVNDDG